MLIIRRRKPETSMDEANNCAPENTVDGEAICDSRGRIEALNSIGVTLHRNKFYQEALSCYSNAMQIGKHAIGSDSEFLKRRISGITLPSFQGSVSEDQYRKLRPNRKCSESYKLSDPMEIDLTVKGPQQRLQDFMVVLYNISLLHYQLGSLHIAETLIRMALSYIEEEDKNLFLSEFSSVFLLIKLFYSLGNVLFYRGDSNQLVSFDMYTEALHLAEEYLSPHVLVAQLLNSIGRVMCRSQDWRGGLDAYDEALRMYNTIKFCVGDAYVEENSFCSGAA